MAEPVVVEGKELHFRGRYILPAIIKNMQERL
jgi:hypothetical protein